MIRKTHAWVDLAAIQKNYIAIQQGSGPDPFVCPMVKADAYGHGSIEVTQALYDVGARHFGVSLVEEGIELRNAGFNDISILTFCQIDSDNCDDFFKYNLTPVIGCLESLQWLHERKKQPVVFHLKVESGMNRMGLPPEHLEPALQIISQSEFLQLEGLCSHLPKGDQVGSNPELLERFARIEDRVKEALGSIKFVHLYNSDGAMHRHELVEHPMYSRFCQWGLRPGIALYGGLDSRMVGGFGFHFLPAMGVVAPLVAVRSLAAGQEVSYNGTWATTKQSVIGTLPFGYADGAPRVLSNKIGVGVQGQTVPQVGTICMDYLMIDISGLEVNKQQVGQMCEILGGLNGSETAVSWASKGGTISYEIMTGLSKRLPRKYLPSING